MKIIKANLDIEEQSKLEDIERYKKEIVDYLYHNSRFGEYMKPSEVALRLENVLNYLKNRL